MNGIQENKKCEFAQDVNQLGGIQKRKFKRRNEIEVWKPIDDFPNYEVSNLGRVRRPIYRDKIVNKILKPFIDHFGYCQLSLCFKGKVYRRKIHHLVLEAFVSKKPSIKIVANHLNGIKHDNRVQNLEWCTYSENMIHAYKMGLLVLTDRKGTNNGRSKLIDSDIPKIIALRNKGKTLIWIANKYKVAFSLIHRITRGESWSHVKR
jgi:hypothetical protein